MALTLARERREQEVAGGLVGKVRNGGDNRGPEHMFDKVVTPSDVGKLNRLVVPKHFAERYFPAARGNPAGTVLCFEEEEEGGGGGGGRTWLFRYSYWSSSQSYVMTKGWSRFVRDKRLAAGDTVSFCRGPGGRLFIGCRRRGGAPAVLAPSPQAGFTVQHGGRCLRLFGVDLVPGADQPLPPLLLDLQLALRR